MPAYSGFHKKKTPLATTLTIVAAIHVAAAAGLIWLSQTEMGRELMDVYKIKLAAFKEKPPELPPPPPEPEPPPPEPEVAPPEPAPVEVAASEPVLAPPVQASRPVNLPAFGNPFGGSGKRGKFAGYVDIVTAEIQRRYIQPPELPEDMSYAVLCQLLLDEEGKILSYKLVNSSGNALFDRSALQALASVERLRPPPQDMSRTITVKFYPPTSG